MIDLSVDAVVVLTARQSKSIVQYSHSISIPLASNPTLVGLWKVAHKPACDCFVLITVCEEEELVVGGEDTMAT